MPERFSPPEAAGLGELIEKSAPRYDARETGLLKRLYPELDGRSDTEIGETFRVGDTSLSLFEISSLAIMFPEKAPDELRDFLADEARLKEYVDRIAVAPKTEQQKFWQVFAILPLPEGMGAYIFQKLGASGDVEPPAENAHEAKTDDEVSAWTPMPVNLPLASLPRLETYLGSSTAKEHFEIPPASLFISDRNSGKVEQLMLSQQETAAAMAYAKSRLSYIDKNRENLTAKYRQEHSLAEDAAVDFSELKDYFFRSLTQRRLAELAEERFASEGKTFDKENSAIELRFSQRKKGLSAGLKTTIRSPDLLAAHFAAKTGKEAPAMIPLSVLNHHIRDGEVFAWEELPADDVKREFRPPQQGEREPFRGKEFLNELQQAHIEIAHATKSGDWSKAIDLYIRYLEYWPQFIEHRAGVIDIANKTAQGIIKEFPKRVLSVASGPHEELRAQAVAAEKFGHPVPEVVSLDASDEMLQKSRAALPEALKGAGKDVISDMRKLPFEKGSFDMIECSSFDNLRDDADIKEMVARMAEALKVGGVARFMAADPFSEQFCQALEKNGFTILEKNKALTLADDAREKLREQSGDEVLKRIEYKMKRHVYFLARLDAEPDGKKLEQDLSTAGVFAPLRRMTAGAIKESLTDRMHGQIEGSAFDDGVNLAVALNPVFFLEKKNLREENLRYALEQLKGRIELSQASSLYKTYFSDAKLSKYCDTVFETIAGLPEAKRFFSVYLLGHDNERVRTLFETYVKERAGSYLIPLIESEFSEDEKKGFLAGLGYSDAVREKLEQYLARMAGDEAKLVGLTYVFESLPQGAKLELPLEMRFSDSLRKRYFEFQKGSPKEGGYTEAEVRKFFAGPPKGIAPEIALTTTALAMAAGDPALAKNVLHVFRSQDDRWLSEAANTHREGLQNLISTLKAVEKGEELLRLQEFEKKHLGAAVDEKESAKILREALRERFRRVFDAYFLPRKSIEKTKDDFRRDTDALCATFAKEFNLPIEEVYLLLPFEISRVMPEPRTPKATEMYNLTVPRILGKFSERLGELEPAAWHRIFRKWLDNGDLDSRAKDGFVESVRANPTLMLAPEFRADLKKAAEKRVKGDHDWSRFSPFMDMAMGLRSSIPDAELRVTLGFLEFMRSGRQADAADSRAYVAAHPESTPYWINRLLDYDFEYYASNFKTLPETLKESVIKKVKGRFYYGQMSDKDLAFLNEHRRNEFFASSLRPQYNRDLRPSGYEVGLADGGKVFVPLSLVDRSVPFHNIDPNMVRITLVPSNRGSGVVGKMSVKR